MSIDSDNEILIDDECVFEVDKQVEGARRLSLINSGTDQERLEPTLGGKTHNKVKRKI